MDDNDVSTSPSMSDSEVVINVKGSVIFFVILDDKGLHS